MGGWYLRWRTPPRAGSNAASRVASRPRHLDSPSAPCSALTSTVVVPTGRRRAPGCTGARSCRGSARTKAHLRWMDYRALRGRYRSFRQPSQPNAYRWPGIEAGDVLFEIAWAWHTLPSEPPGPIRHHQSEPPSSRRNARIRAPATANTTPFAPAGLAHESSMQVHRSSGSRRTILAVHTGSRSGVNARSAPPNVSTMTSAGRDHRRRQRVRAGVDEHLAQHRPIVHGQRHDGVISRALQRHEHDTVGHRGRADDRAPSPERDPPANRSVIEIDRLQVVGTRSHVGIPRGIRDEHRVTGDRRTAPCLSNASRRRHRSRDRTPRASRVDRPRRYLP